MPNNKLSPEVRKQLQQLLVQHPQTIWQRLRQLITPLLGAFGLVSLFYGFEGVLSQTALADQPLMMIAFGTLLLLLTGSFYSKL